MCAPESCGPGAAAAVDQTRTTSLDPLSAPISAPLPLLPLPPPPPAAAAPHLIAASLLPLLLLLLLLPLEPLPAVASAEPQSDKASARSLSRCGLHEWKHAAGDARQARASPSAAAAARGGRRPQSSGSAQPPAALEPLPPP
jgi:hypothetical protein